MLKMLIRAEEFDIVDAIRKKHPHLDKISRKDSRLWLTAAQEYFHKKFPRRAARKIIKNGLNVKKLKRTEHLILSEELAHYFIFGRTVEGGRFSEELLMLFTTKSEYSIYNQFREDEPMVHSFEIVSGINYASSVHKDLGVGGEARVKLMQARDGSLKAKRIAYARQTKGVFSDTISHLSLLLKEIGREHESRVRECAVTESIPKKFRNPRFNLISEGKIITSKQIIFTPYRNGGELYHFIKDYVILNKLDIAHSYLLMLMIAEALWEQCGKHNIVHCDIKPENILMHHSKGERVIPENLHESQLFIEDLSFAKQFSGPACYTVSFGTKGYRSPEVEKHHELTKKSDVFALGKIFYHILTRIRYSSESDYFGKDIVDGCTAIEPKLRTSTPELLKILEQGLISYSPELYDKYRETHLRPELHKSATDEDLTDAMYLPTSSECSTKSSKIKNTNMKNRS